MDTEYIQVFIFLNSLRTGLWGLSFSPSHAMGHWNNNEKLRVHTNSSQLPTQNISPRINLSFHTHFVWFSKRISYYYVVIIEKVRCAACNGAYDVVCLHRKKYCSHSVFIFNIRRKHPTHNLAASWRAYHERFIWLGKKMLTFCKKKKKNP